MLGSGQATGPRLSVAGASMDPWTAPPQLPPPAVPPGSGRREPVVGHRRRDPLGRQARRGDRRHRHRCETLRAHLAAVEAAALVEVEDRKIARQQLAWSSTGDWYTHIAGTHPRTGRRTVRHAKLLVGERTATRDALRDGLVSPEQAGVIVDAIEELPTNPHLRELAEKTLLAEAGRLHATDLAKAARHLLHVVDPEAPNARPNGTSTPRTAPPTSAATWRSPRTAPAASACAAGAPWRTPPPSRPPCCRSPNPPRRLRCH